MLKDGWHYSACIYYLTSVFGNEYTYMQTVQLWAPTVLVNRPKLYKTLVH